MISEKGWNIADDRFDLVVIGGGGADYAVASNAARLGRRVAMVEASKLGGTCLNRGCVPTKTLVRTARVLDTLRGAAELGIDIGPIRLDCAAVQARRAAIIRGFSGEAATAERGVR
ncbi:MAG: FAD-dependent oxidoreductase [Chloroflexi bacterium]|nr:FAD-dependent oxidoreductase [Chloroflexota bacterium]